MTPENIQLSVDQAWKGHGKSETQTIAERELKPMLTDVLTKMGVAGPQLLGTNYEQEYAQLEKDAHGGVSKETFQNMVAKMATATTS